MEKTIEITYPKTPENPDGLPLPIQEAFHNSPARYRLFAGGFGSGKTTSLAIEVIYSLLKYPDNYGVLGRKDLMELKSTTLKELIDLLPEQLIKSHNKSDRVLTLYNNSSLYYMPLDDAREAVEKIKSLNLGFVAVDQLEEISEDVFLAFVGRLRRQNSERNFFATCNPAGHDWVYRRWKFNNSPDYQLFEAKTTDNPYLPPDYVQNMIDNYPDNWVKRYIYCSWDEFDGLVYSQFIEQKHKIPPYIPAPQEKKYIIADYGYRNPTAVLFAATDYDGVTRIYDEYYEPGKLISEVSDVIKSMPDYRTATKLIDPSTRNRQRDGYSVWDEFAQNGVYFQPANNDVIQGINRVNELFKRGVLLICSNCVNLLNEIGGYKWQALKVGTQRNEPEQPIKKDDHACDALRYLVNEIYAPPKPKKVKPLSSRAIASKMATEIKTITSF